MTRGLLVTDKVSMVWNAPRQFVPKNKVKLLLNMCVIVGATIPRGGVITVDIAGQGDDVVLTVASKGTNPRLAHGVTELLAGQPEAGKVDAHTIQPYFTGLVARECGMSVAVEMEAEGVKLTARPTTATLEEAAPAVLPEATAASA